LFFNKYNHLSISYSSSCLNRCSLIIMGWVIFTNNKNSIFFQRLFWSFCQDQMPPMYRISF
jgi:hypothetical protein